MCDSKEEQLSFPVQQAVVRVLWSTEIFKHGTFGSIDKQELYQLPSNVVQTLLINRNAIVHLHEFSSAVIFQQILKYFSFPFLERL